MQKAFFIAIGQGGFLRFSLGGVKSITQIVSNHGYI
jgi:hypothetical protein